MLVRVQVNQGLVVKWLSRLPVTEEIAGSSPVEPAKKKSHPCDGSFFIGRFRPSENYFLDLAVGFTLAVQNLQRLAADGMALRQ